MSKLTHIALLALCSAWLGIANANADGNNNSTTACAQFKGDCEKCVVSSACYYCKSSGKCHDYKWSSTKTWFKHCSWSSARWKNCWLNVEALVICCSILGGLMLISLTCCCCYVNRRMKARSRRNAQREMDQVERRQTERSAEQDERRREREERREAMRVKYGLPGNKGRAQPYKKLAEES